MSHSSPCAAYWQYYVPVLLYVHLRAHQFIHADVAAVCRDRRVVMWFCCACAHLACRYSNTTSQTPACSSSSLAEPLFSLRRGQWVRQVLQRNSTYVNILAYGRAPARKHALNPLSTLSRPHSHMGTEAHVLSFQSLVLAPSSIHFISSLLCPCRLLAIRLYFLHCRLPERFARFQKPFKIVPKWPQMVCASIFVWFFGDCVRRYVLYFDTCFLTYTPMLAKHLWQNDGSFPSCRAPHTVLHCPSFTTAGLYRQKPRRWWWI